MTRTMWAVIAYYETGGIRKEYTAALAETKELAAAEAGRLMLEELNDDCLPVWERSRYVIRSMAVVFCAAAPEVG